MLIFSSFAALAQETPSYWGQTGMAIPARYFDNPAELKWYVLPDNSTERDFRKFRQYILDNFTKATPRIELMLRIRDQLPALIDAFYVNNPSELGERFWIFIHQNREIYADKRVQFEFDTKGKFQVDGIEQNRLGINTGSEIFFNVDGILKKENFTVGEIVQLWMHEILHADREIPLAERDAWTAQFAQWVQEHTKEFELSHGRKFISVNLPRVLRQVMDADAIKTKTSFLAFLMDNKNTRLVNEIYDGFATFGNFLNNSQPSAIRSTNAQLMPIVEVTAVRKTNRDSLQFDYVQDSIFFDNAMKSGTFRGLEGIGYNGNFRPPAERFRMEWFPESDTFELSRTYSGVLASDDFEIFRVKDQGEKRFLSIRIKSQNIKALKDAKTLHLLARNTTDGKTLSFEIHQMRALNAQELLVRVEVPQTSMEISQILLPDTSGERYSEIAIRPSQPARLQGPEMSHLPIQNIKSIAIKTRKVEKDKALISIQLKSADKIKGISFDMEHFVQGYKFDMRNGNMENSLKMDLGMGRKYYLRRSEIQFNKDGSLQIEIPNVTLDKYQQGPTFQRNFGPNMHFSQSDRLAYLRDNLERKLSALWIHYDDGRVEKAPAKLVPKSWVSIRPENEKKREIREKRKAEERAIQYRLESARAFFAEFGDLLGDEDPEEKPAEPEISAKTCNELFD